MEVESTAALIQGIIPFVLMLAVFYFMLIRPPRKRDKAMKAMIEALKVGDEIVTIGGIYGKITSIKDDTLMVETGSGNDKSKVKIARWSIKECLTIKE